MYFVLDNIDAIITTASGVFTSLYAWQKRAQLQRSEKPLVRALPWVGPFIIVFGLVQLVHVPSLSYTWQRIYTGDHQASAEFPCATNTELATDSIQGLQIKRMVVRCGVPHRDIDLRLSYNEVPPQGTNATIEQRTAAMRNFLLQQGFVIVSWNAEEHSVSPCFRIVAEKTKNGGRTVMRVAIKQNGIYRVLATSTAGFHDDPVIPRFIDSFIFD